MKHIIRNVYSSEFCSDINLAYTLCGIAVYISWNMYQQPNFIKSFIVLVEYIVFLLYSVDNVRRLWSFNEIHHV